MQIAAATLIFCAICSPTIDASLRHHSEKRITSDYCTIAVDPSDSITLTHIDSVLRSHHIHIRFYEHSIYDFIVVAASPDAIKTILNSDAPHEIFRYGVDAKVSPVIIQRRWIDLPISISQVQGNSAPPPPPILKWLSRLRHTRPIPQTAQYVPVRYMNAADYVTGYILRKGFTQPGGEKTYVEEQLLSGHANPSSRSFIRNAP